MDALLLLVGTLVAFGAGVLAGVKLARARKAPVVALPVAAELAAPLPAAQVEAGQHRFRVEVEHEDGSREIAYAGASGAAARRQHEAHASYADRRVTFRDAGAVRGFSDFGSTR